jgi:phytoene desaturase
VCEAFEAAGYRLDLGPTLLVMKDVLEALFADAGERLEDHMRFRRVVPNYEVRFADGERLTFWPDRARMAAEVERLEPGAGPGFHRLLDEARGMYRDGRRAVLERNFRHLGDALTAPIAPMAGLALLSRGRLDGYLGRFFRDRRLRDAFGFQVLYLGMSPYDSPALFALLAAIELDEGILFPEGGMASIATAIAKVASARGVAFRYGTRVRHIDTDGDRATGVTLADGSRLDAELVVANASLPTAYRELLDEAPPKRHDRLRPGASAFVMAMGLDTRLDGLGHHTLVLPADTRKTYAQLDAGRLPDELFMYLCAPSVTQPELAPPGGTCLYALTMAPHTRSGLDWDAEAPRLRARMLDRLDALGFGDVRPHLRAERVMHPGRYEGELGIAWGTPFGATQHLDQVGPCRPANRHRAYGNLYFTGANTHPGGGVPMVLLSARLVAERVAREQP